MDSIQNILTRRSIRSYEERRISEEDMRTILAAAMSGPSCADTRDWQFIVVENKETLNQMADANGIYAAPLRGAAAGILICGDLNKAFPPAKEYWVVDGAIAGQNICLAARALGIGSVWLGTWPQMDRVKNLAGLFRLPESVVPHSVIALGYSGETEDISGKGTYDESCIHRETW
ncbi:MAG: nitroreductase family protein [Oscillospiraceae bacterium]